jgi:hypothetical protein
VNLNAYTGIQTPGNLIKMANTQQYVAAYNTAAMTDGREQIPQSVIDTLPDVNWLKEVLKNAPVNNLQVGISGGNENSQYIVSANYFDQQGLINNSSYQRFNIRTAVNSSLSKLFKVGTNINTQNKGRLVLREMVLAQAIPVPAWYDMLCSAHRPHLFITKTVCWLICRIHHNSSGMG